MGEIVEKMLKVQWNDARYSEGWLRKDEMANIRSYRLENVGYGFVKENGDIVMCSQKDMEDEEYRRYWLIPKKYITSIEELVIKVEGKQ